MTIRGILIVAGIFLGLFLVLFLGRCGYERLEIYQSLDSIAAHVRSEFPEVAPIDGDTLQLYRENESGTLLVDVRSEEGYASSHIPGALSLSSGEAIRQHVAESKVPIERLVVYGSVGTRSAEVIRELGTVEGIRVFHLEGGLFRWANEGRARVDASGEAAEKVHPYNSVWARFLDEERRGELPSEGDGDRE